MATTCRKLINRPIPRNKNCSTRIYPITYKKDSKFALESFLNVQTIHRSGITGTHAREGSTAQEMQIPRAVEVHRSGIGKSTRRRSTAQDGNPTRRNVPPLRNYRIPRSSSSRTRAVNKNLIYHNPSHTKKDVEKLNKLSCTNIQESTV